MKRSWRDLSSSVDFLPKTVLCASVMAHATFMSFGAGGEAGGGDEALVTGMSM